mgnify:CR=1 FL=1
MTNNANNDPFGKAFNLTPISNTELTTTRRVTEIVSAAHNDSAKNDFEVARANIHELIDTGTYALQGIARVAEQSQHPRAFEVLAKMMDTLLQANKDLLTIQKEIRDIDAADVPTNETAKQVTQNLFVSTAELAAMIDKVKRKDE